LANKSWRNRGVSNSSLISAEVPSLICGESESIEELMKDEKPKNWGCFLNPGPALVECRA